MKLMVDKERFLKAMVYLFYSKGKEEPKGKMVEVWYSELKNYDENKVMSAFKKVCRTQTFGVQVADITNIVDPEIDHESNALVAWDQMIDNIKSGVAPDKWLFSPGLLSWSMYEGIKHASNDFSKSQLKREFLSRFIKRGKGETIAIENKKQRVQIDPKIGRLINESIPAGSQK